MGSREYNQIYGKLVEGDDDLVGQVAYALYKKEKHAWVKRFCERYNSEPTDEDLSSFHCTICSPENVFRFRLQASGIITQTINGVIKKTTDQVQDELNRDHKERLKTIVKDLVPRFWTSVFQSVLASFIFSMLILAIIAFVKLGNIDYVAWFEWLR